MINISLFSPSAGRRSARYTLLLSLALAGSTLSATSTITYGADGALGSSSSGTATINLRIIRTVEVRLVEAQAVEITAVETTATPPAGFFSGSAELGASDDISGSQATGTDSNLIAEKQFFVDDTETQEWFAKQMADDGEANFSVCVPEGSGGLSFLDSAGGTTDFISMGDSGGGYAMSISSGASSPGGDSCSGGGTPTSLQVTMITATAAGGTNLDEPPVTSKKPSGQYAKVNLVIIPN